MTEANDRLAEKEQSVTDWNAVFETVRQLNIPQDSFLRARDIAQMNAEDLIAMATLLHSKLAPDSDMSPTDFRMKVNSPDGTNVAELILPEDRYGLYQHGAELINKLGQDLGKDDDEDFLVRAGNIAALTILITHPFEDGNGRTARFMTHLIREGFDETEDTMSDLKTLGTNRPSEGFKINSFVPRMGEMKPNEYLTAVAALDIPLTESPANYEQATTGLLFSPYL